jgi:hypothetical protein
VYGIKGLVPNANIELWIPSGMNPTLRLCPGLKAPLGFKTILGYNIVLGFKALVG